MNLEFLKGAFKIHGDFVSAGSYGSGHINDTYAAVYSQSGRQVRYLHQRINHKVFRDVPALMDNISRVITFNRARLRQEAVPDPSRRCLTLLPSTTGNPYHVDEEGCFWRTYLFLEGASTYDRLEDRAQAGEAARAFGKFQKMLSGFTGQRLHETIPDFHNTPRRYAAFHRILELDTHNRAAGVRAEVAWFLEREAAAGVVIEALNSGEIPERITHNDTKLNNVMLDDATGEGICVIDLDTVMPGSSLYDFGDMVRSMTNSGREDSQDASGIEMRFPVFKSLMRGYLSEMRDCLTEREVDLLAFSGKLISLEIGLRFLTDYLDGDRYFKVHREGQNLDRCRTHMALVESIERQQSEMEKAVRKEMQSCGC